MSEFISPKHRKLRSTFESIERQFAQMERLSCEQRALGLAEDLTTQDAVRNTGNTGNTGTKYGKYGDRRDVHWFLILLSRKPDASSIKAWFWPEQSSSSLVRPPQVPESRHMYQHSFLLREPQNKTKGRGQACPERSEGSARVTRAECRFGKEAVLWASSYSCFSAERLIMI
jgi:hypothetical protein